MATTAATLEILVNARTAQATSSLRRLDQSSRTSATHLGRLDRASSKLSGVLSSAGKAAIGAAAAYVGISQAKEAISTTTDLAKTTINLRNNLGLAGLASGELAAVLKAKNVDTKQAGMAFKTFANNLEQAKQGSASAITTFGLLGITGKKLATDIKNPQQALFDVSDGLKNAGAGVDRLSTQGKLFGRGWQALSPIIRGGASSLRDYLNAAEPVGKQLNMNKEQLHALIQAEFKSKLAILQLQVAFTTKLAPALTWILNVWPKWLALLGRFTGISFIFRKDVQQNIVGALKDARDWIKTAWQDVGHFLAAPFGAAVKDITGFVNAIISVINTVLGPVGVHIGSVGGGGGGGGPPGPSGPTNPPKKKPKKQRGGFAGIVPGSGSGDKVPIAAMTEPGEGLFVMNRNAMGALESFNQGIPRFASGGILGTGLGPNVGPDLTPGFNLPGVGGLPGWLQPAGSFVLAKAGGFIKDKLTGPFSGKRGGGGTTMWGGKPVANWIIPELKWAQTQGWSGTVSSGWRDFATQAALYARYLAGGPLAAAPGTSEHESTAYPGGAVDLTDYMTMVGLVGRYPGAQKLKWFGSGDPVHFSGTGHQKGGVVAPQHGTHWLKLGHYNMDQAATLLWQAGLSMSQASDLSRVIGQESGGDPHAGPSSGGAKGLFQIITQSVPGNLYDPRINALNAAALYKANPNMSDWNPSRSGWAAHGGTVKPGLVAGSKTKVPKTKKSKKAKGSGGGGDTSAADDAMQAMLDAVDARNQIIGTVNDLIGSGNLEALQRYQTGVAQNPLLGISSPGKPSLASLLPLETVDSMFPPAPPQANTISSAGSSNFQVGQHGVKGGVTGHWKRHIHIHNYIDGKEVRSVTKKEMRRASNRGRRGLPSARA